VRFLLWTASCVLLVLMVIGVGCVMTFVFGGASFSALVVGAVLFVMAWHGLRRVDPSRSRERPDEDWGVAILVTVVIGAFMIGSLVWTAWLTVFALIVFPIWLRLAFR
jgi:hypothetical protein